MRHEVINKRKYTEDMKGEFREMFYYSSAD
jgi:hypothetical protein